MARLLPQTIESTSYSSNGAHTQSDTVPNAIPNHYTNTFPYNHHHEPPNTFTYTDTYNGTTQYNKPPNRYTYRNTNLNTNINTSQQYDTPTPHNRSSTNNNTFTIRAVPITTFTRRQYTARGVVGCGGFHLVRDWWCPRMAYGESTTGLCTTSRR
eukprot:PhF_6_TR993/c0_g1_i6/m.1954